MINCDLCGKYICKYELDFNASGGVWLSVKENSKIDENVMFGKIKYLCQECAKRIAHIVVDN